MNAIIIDDEQRARLNLRLIINEYCPELKILAECENLPEGVKAIRKHKPDLVLLDIEMPGHSGLELLDFFDENDVDFSIIFTTAYNEYAIQAFKFSAVDYLLKPIDPLKFIEAMSLFKRKHLKLQNYRTLSDNMSANGIYKIAVPSGNKLIFIDAKNILYIKGEGAYSTVFCDEKVQHLVSRNLKNFEDIICLDDRFLRVHKSYIVNMEKVQQYCKSDGGTLILNAVTTIPISNKNLNLILEKINIISR